jgi:O-antigen/teichoic acid export membrane protein
VGLVEVGLSISTTVFLAQDLTRKDDIGASQTLTVTFGAMLVLATLAAVFLWQGTPLLINLFPDLDAAQRSAASAALRVGAVAVWARLLQQILVGVLHAFRRYGIANFLLTAQAVVTSIGLIGLAWYTGRIVVLIQWQVIVTIAALLALVWAGRRELAPLDLHLAWDPHKSRKIVRYSATTWVVLLSSALFSQVDRLLVGGILGAASLGVYAAITNVTNKINGLSAAAVQPLLPELSNRLAQQHADHLGIVKRIRQAVTLNAAVAFGMAGALFALAPLIMQVLLADSSAQQFTAAFQLATVIYALYSINAVGYYILFGTSALGKLTVVQLASSVCALVLIAWGAHRAGILGAIAGNAGYIGTWLLIPLGMTLLSIAPRTWTRWLRFPLVWFVCVLASNGIIVGSLIGRVVVTMIALVILFVWFAKQIRPSIVQAR